MQNTVAHCVSCGKEMQINLLYRAELTEGERGELEGMSRGGKHPVCELKRA